MKILVFTTCILGLLLQQSLAIFEGEEWKAGLVDLERGDDMFYILFKSRRSPENDPLVMWLTGGPGCSSEIALFYENGPVWLNPDKTFSYN